MLKDIHTESMKKNDEMSNMNKKSKVNDKHGNTCYAD